MANDQDFVSRAGDRLHRNRGKTLLLIFVFALAVRAGATLGTLGNAPIPVGSDAGSYDTYAKEILKGDWLGRPVSFREVGYPFFLSLTYRVLGDSPAAGRLINAVLGAFTCVLIFFLAEKIFGFNVAVLAAIWSTVNAQFLFFNTMMIRETLITFLFAVLLLLLFRASANRSLRYVLLAALTLVALIHTDARYLFHVPFVVLYFFLTGKGFRTPAGKAAVFVLVFVLGMIPWQYRNYKAYNRFVLVNTWTLEMPFPWQKDPTPVPLHLVHPNKRLPEPLEGTRRLEGFRRVIYEFNEFYRICRFRGEVKNRTATYDKPWSVKHNVTSILTYGSILPFFMVGLWVVLRERRKDAYVLVIPVVVQTLLHVIKFALPRYRVPVEPAIIILGVFGLSCVWMVFKRRRQHSTGLRPA